MYIDGMKLCEKQLNYMKLYENGMKLYEKQ